MIWSRKKANTQQLEWATTVDGEINMVRWTFYGGGAAKTQNINYKARRRRKLRESAGVLKDLKRHETREGTAEEIRKFRAPNPFQFKMT